MAGHLHMADRVAEIGLHFAGRIAGAVNIPVIASGGVGTLEHLHQGIAIGGADAVLAASIFHYKEYSIRECKEYLKKRGVVVRM